MDLWLQSMMKFIFSYANLLALLLKPNNIKIKEKLRIAMIEPIFVKNTTTTTTTTTTITTTTVTVFFYCYKKQHAIHNKNNLHNGKMVSSPNSGQVSIDQQTRTYIEMQLYS